MQNIFRKSEALIILRKLHFSLFQVPFLYPLKISENHLFSDVFVDIERKHWRETRYWKSICCEMKTHYILLKKYC